MTSSAPAPPMVSGTPSHRFVFPTPHASVASYDDWTPRGVYMHGPTLLRSDTRDTANPSADANANADAASTDSSTLPVPLHPSYTFVTVVGSDDASSSTAKSGVSRTDKGRVKLEDCWKIGEEGSGWQEPPETYTSSYDTTTPPFTRLIDACRQFLYSRHNKLAYQRSKLLFDRMRDVLGIKVDVLGGHWPGSGPNGQVYEASNAAKRNGYLPGYTFENESSGGSGAPAFPEVCPLLRRPDAAVRGFLALARKEAEAMWDVEPALELTRMTSAFLSYIEHYEIFPEDYICIPFARATRIARSAVQKIRDASAFEDELDREKGWNGTAWTVFGGQYGKRETIFEAQARGDNEVTGSVSAEDIAAIEEWCSPLDVRTVRVLQYTPFQRRRITSILPPPPHEADVSLPAFMKTFYRVGTEAAPWTAEEGWKRNAWSPPRKERVVPTPGMEYDATTYGEAFEREPPTMTGAGDGAETAPMPPSEVVLWVDDAGLKLDTEEGRERLVNVGLRGRWIQIGIPGGPNWWLFKPKDYVLPAFWKSSPEELEEVARDPKPNFSAPDAGA